MHSEPLDAHESAVRAFLQGSLLSNEQRLCLSSLDPLECSKKRVASDQLLERYAKAPKRV